MNTSIKRKNLIIAICLTLILILGTVFAFIFMPKKVSADSYNYGQFNEVGYYSLDGVTFYGVKIKQSTSKTYDCYPITDAKFTIGIMQYTIDSLVTPEKVTWNSSGSADISNDGTFKIGLFSCLIDDMSNPANVSYSQTKDVTVTTDDEGNQSFLIKEITYTISYDSENNQIVITYKDEETSDIDNESKTFEIYGTTYTFDDLSNPAKVTWDGGEALISDSKFNIAASDNPTISCEDDLDSLNVSYSQTRNVEVKEEDDKKYFEIDEKKYYVTYEQIDEVDNFSITYIETQSTPITTGQFEIGGETYTINNLVTPTEIKDSKDKKVCDVDDNNKFWIGTKQYAINGNYVVGTYWPSYEVVKENGKPVVVKFGETTLLKDDEAILLSFARQTDDQSGLVADSNGNIISKQIDFAYASISVNGKSDEAAINNFSGSGASGVKELGYIIDPNNCFDGNSAGLKRSSGEEGLVEFATRDYVVDGQTQQFSFMFYVFKQSTYKRTESTNTISEFVRPNATISNATGQVSDPATQSEFFAEYYFDFSNQNLPYLEFDPTRTQVAIKKTIHSTVTNYEFEVNSSATSSQETVLNNKITTVVETVGKNSICQTISQSLATLDVYARPLRVESVKDESNEDTGKIRVYFEDVGQYTISYTAVYINEKNEKIVLDSINTDNRLDKLTIFGTQFVYQDFEAGQTPLRNQTNTIHADLTGIVNNGTLNTFTGVPSTEPAKWTLKLSSDVTIASTNQPPIKLLFNATVESFDVYYSETLGGDYTKADGYSYTSSFDKPGYYVVKLTSEFDGYKTWLPSSKTVKTETKSSDQIFVFRIKQQTSNLEVYRLDENGNVVEGSERVRVYSDNYVKNGVQIIEFEKANEFDSEVSFELVKTLYETTKDEITINLPNAKAEDLTEEQKAYLSSFGISKESKNGSEYYVLKNSSGVDVDAKYTLSLKFGKTGKETISFMLDTKPIDGIMSYALIYDSNLQQHNKKEIGSSNVVALTNKSFAVTWKDKASKAAITAKYVRFALNDEAYATDAKDYILNDTWLAANSVVNFADGNPETIYEKTDLDKINSGEGSKSILSLSGYYIFKLEDAAGNVEYFSVLLDDSQSVVLQKSTDSENYEIITGINNVSSATQIFFGEYKAIKFDVDASSLTSSETVAATYLKEILNNKTKYDSKGIIQEVSGSMFFTVEITDVYKEKGDEGLKKITLTDGRYIQGTSMSENGTQNDVTYKFYVFDASNAAQAQNKTTATTTYQLNFNTDQTGLTLTTGKQKGGLVLTGTKTQSQSSIRTKYYKATAESVVTLNLTTLQIDKMNAKVDLDNDGLVCMFYPLEYNSKLETYSYRETGSKIELGVSETNKSATINAISGVTLAGKYVITRKYSEIDKNEKLSLGQDYETVELVLLVDRNEIITAPSVTDETIGSEIYIETFDGDKNSQTFKELYRQNQNSVKAILETNQLPIGFYVPVSKYGHLDNGTFINTVEFTGLDEGKTYSPFKLSVVLISPEIVDGKNVYYYYSSINSNNYFVLSGYSIGELNADEQPTEIKEQDRGAFVKGSYESWIKSGAQGEYTNGTYVLLITSDVTLVESDNLSNQKFKVCVDVKKPSPESNLVANYPSFPNVSQFEVNKTQDGTYLTNAEELVVSWEKSANKYITAIDPFKVYYKIKFTDNQETQFGGYSNRFVLLKEVVSSNETKQYLFIDGAKQEIVDSKIKIGEDEKYSVDFASSKIIRIADKYEMGQIDITIKQVGNTFSFSIPNLDDAKEVKITTSFEVYSSDSGSAHKVYYGQTAHTQTHTVEFDTVAPTSSLKTLAESDKTLNGIASDSLWTQGTRFTKSVSEGTFAYYTYVANSDYLQELSGKLEKNSASETKEFYYRAFNEKYTNSLFKETGIGFDKNSQPNNLFNKQTALLNGWTVGSSEVSGELSGLYEVVEIDLAGNMTIYSVYLRNDGLNRKITIKYTGQQNKKVEISKNITINASIGVVDNAFNDDVIDDILTNELAIDEKENVTLNNIDIAITGSDYRYLKLKIDNETYYVTPFNFTTKDGTVACTSLFNAKGEEVKLSSIQLTQSATSHKIEFIDTIFGEEYKMLVNVADESTKLKATMISNSDQIFDEDKNPVSKSIALVVSLPKDSSINLKEDTLRIFKITSEGAYVTYSIEVNKDVENKILKYTNSTSATETIYYYLPYDEDFKTSVFFTIYKDNFNNEYKQDIFEYESAQFDRFEGDFDVTDSNKDADEIVVSGNISVNISNVYGVKLTDEKGGDVSGKFNLILSQYLGKSYKQYQLLLPQSNTVGFSGGKSVFVFNLSYNIPSDLQNEIKEAGFNLEDNGVIKTIKVTIFNETPTIKATDLNGQDISTKLFAKDITQSDAITLSFLTESENATSLGISTKVFLRKRGEDFKEITSPCVVSEPGTYDIQIQNFDSQGNALDYVVKKDFVISDLDVMFYTVVKTNEQGEQEVVTPTGVPYEYEPGVYASYHYILNTSSYNIKNVANVEIKQIKETSDGSSSTKIYEIISTSGTIFRATIAITVVSQTNDFFSQTPFAWYLGTVYTSLSDSNNIKTTLKEIFLCKEDLYDEISLSWPAYFACKANTIVCEISSDGGATWFQPQTTTENGKTTLVISKSATYLFRFKDLAGNVQKFLSSSSASRQETQINFVRSVIYKVNDQNPIDNAVYNGTVKISLPLSTSNFYSNTPQIVATRNNEAYTPTTQNGEYVFSESGVYTIYFTAKVESGTKDLNEDVLTFTIVNANDSRWAFNYVNYNNFEVKQILFNNVELDSLALARALEVGNEINISAFDRDEDGNKWFENGIYTIVLETNDSALGTQQLSFSFWLNSAVAPISISLPEGQETTSSVVIEYNRSNLFDVLGDCYITINDTVIDTINETNLGSEKNSYNLSSYGTHYIQVYTSTGKLVYSYQVKINEPLNTITIILIVVSCVVAAGGLLTFFLLRKKMQVR